MLLNVRASACAFKRSYECVRVYVRLNPRALTSLQGPGDFARDLVAPPPVRLAQLHRDMSALADKLGESTPKRPPVLNGKIVQDDEDDY